VKQRIARPHIPEDSILPLLLFNYLVYICRAIAEAVSRWHPTAAARVSRVGFVVDKVASGPTFSEYFGFPCQNRSFHQLLHPHNHPGHAQYARSGRSAEWTQYGLHPTIFK
jgi:hypothetical protein